MVDKELIASKAREAKAQAKLIGRAGRFRGKAKAKQPNKEKGGKFAR